MKIDSIFKKSSSSFLRAAATGSTTTSAVALPAFAAAPGALVAGRLDDVAVGGAAGPLLARLASESPRP